MVEAWNHWPRRDAVSSRPWNVYNDTHLHKDGKEDDCDDGCDKHVPHWEVVLVEQVDQGESDGSTQATVRYDELVLGCELYYAEFVDHEGQTDDPWDKEKGTGKTILNWNKLLVYSVHQNYHICALQRYSVSLCLGVA